MSGEINLPSYDLDTVANNFLGVGKTGVDIGDLWKVWDEGSDEIGEYCKYNLRDSKLACELFEKMYPNLKEFVKLCGLPPDDIARMGYSQLVESFVMKNLEDFDEIAPNRPYRNVVGEREGRSVEGAGPGDIQGVGFCGGPEGPARAQGHEGHGRHIGPKSKTKFYYSKTQLTPGIS